jgi:hypothetical protein
MPEREIEITIGPDGRVEAHVRGYKGRKCLEAARVLHEIIGEMNSQRETSEFYEPEEEVRLNNDVGH